MDTVTDGESHPSATKRVSFQEFVKEADNRVLTKQALFDSLFELADQWTPDVEASQIVAMYNILEDKIKFPDIIY